MDLEPGAEKGSLHTHLELARMGPRESEVRGPSESPHLQLSCSWSAPSEQGFSVAPLTTVHISLTSKLAWNAALVTRPPGMSGWAYRRYEGVPTTKAQRAMPALAFAARIRISLSCSSFLCFSIWSSCSKNLSWARTSLACSYLSSSYEKSKNTVCHDFGNPASKVSPDRARYSAHQLPSLSPDNSTESGESHMSHLAVNGSSHFTQFDTFW
jgi:hypothetical protein